MNIYIYIYINSFNIILKIYVYTKTVYFCLSSAGFLVCSAGNITGKVGGKYYWLCRR